jgi:TIR domain.
MKPTTVFVSHARSDQGLADELLRALRRMQVNVWSDDQLTAGENWSEVLRARLRDSDYFLLLLTPRTLESSWVLQELGAAWALGKRIVTLSTDPRLVDKLPVEVSGLQTLGVEEMDRLEDVLGRVA